MFMIGNSPKVFPFRSNIDSRGVGIPDIYERYFLACPAPISRELSSIGAGRKRAVLRYIYRLLAVYVSLPANMRVLYHNIKQ